MLSKHSLIWLEDNPNLSSYMQKLVDEKGFSLDICKTLNSFNSRCNFFLNTADYGGLAGFIIDGVISSAYDLEELGIVNVNTNSGTDVGMLVVRDYLLSNPKFTSLPILVLSIVQSPERVYQSIAKVDRFSDGKAPDNVSFITKGRYYEGAPFICSINDWLSGISK